MKKKLGDLTIRELKDEQDIICNIKVSCKECPFKSCCLDGNIDLDQEIEVKENDKNN